MSISVDYSYWKIADHFISQKKYRIVEASPSQTELWLEKREDKQIQVIRLARIDFDWSRELVRDLERTVLGAEQLRKQMTRGEVHVLNLYFSAMEPVDDYEDALENRETSRGKLRVTNKLVTEQNFQEVIADIEMLCGDRIEVAEQFAESDIDRLRRNAIDNAIRERKKEQALFTNGKPFFTYVLIGLQILMFIILETQGGSTNSATLIKYGAKFNPLILQGEWWRFLTPIFLHIGLVHLIMNTLALYYLGPTIERIFGRFRFLLIYFSAGFFGSLASFLFSTSLSAGASGAIFGCFGALLYFGVINPSLFFRTMGMNILVVIGINLSLGFTVPGIDNAGHIGGLIGGFLTTAIVHFPKKKKWLTQMACLLVTVLLAGSMLVYGFSHPERLTATSSTLSLAQYYIQNEQFEEANQLLERAVESGTGEDLSQLYFQLSYSQIQLGQLELAKENLLQAIETDPNFPEAYYNLAIIFANEGETSEALPYAEQALKLNPNQNEYQTLVDKLKQ